MTGDQKTDEILAADFHRNGVGGEGFYVALFKDADDGTTKLIISFDDVQCTAVLEVSELVKGNIYMHPHNDDYSTGNNAWRGDQFASRLYQAIRDRVKSDFDEQTAAWSAKRRARENQ